MPLICTSQPKALQQQLLDGGSICLTIEARGENLTKVYVAIRVIYLEIVKMQETHQRTLEHDLLMCKATLN